MSYTHLNPAQRYQIQRRLADAQPVPVIAHALGVHRSTVYREIERGTVGHVYQADGAQARARQRRRPSAANHPTKPASLWQNVRRLLRQRWSPEQIAGRYQQEGGAGLCQQTIYAWLHRTGSALHSRLRHHRPCHPGGPAVAAYPSIASASDSALHRFNSVRPWVIGKAIPCADAQDTPVWSPWWNATASILGCLP